MINKSRKKIMIIEAVQWNGDNYDEICKFIDKDKFYIGTLYNSNNMKIEKNLLIKTLDGYKRVKKGHYIIKDRKGNFYPCRKDIIENIHEFINGLNNFVNDSNNDSIENNNADDSNKNTEKVNNEKKIYNLVFLEHPNEEYGKKYLFQCPLNIKLEKGQDVACETKYGGTNGICVTDSFIVSENIAKTILLECGGSFPPKNITGTAKIETKKVYVPF